jgi:hypothetical protein
MTRETVAIDTSARSATVLMLIRGTAVRFALTMPFSESAGQHNPGRVFAWPAAILWRRLQR